jgi:hypothetical protein
VVCVGTHDRFRVWGILTLLTLSMFVVPSGGFVVPTIATTTTLRPGCNKELQNICSKRPNGHFIHQFSIRRLASPALQDDSSLDDKSLKETSVSSDTLEDNSDSFKNMLKFALPALGIYLSNPLLSNIDNGMCIVYQREKMSLSANC